MNKKSSRVDYLGHWSYKLGGRRQLKLDRWRAISVDPALAGHSGFQRPNFTFAKLAEFNATPLYPYTVDIIFLHLMLFFK